MKIKVTQRHIDIGFHQSRLQNPVSLAMQDAGLALGVVDFRDNFLGWNNNEIKKPIPDSVKCWLKAFEDGKKVKPFSFELKVPLNSISYNDFTKTSKNFNIKNALDSVSSMGDKLDALFEKLDNTDTIDNIPFDNMENLSLTNTFHQLKITQLVMVSLYGALEELQKDVEETKFCTPPDQYGDESFFN